MEPFRHSRDKLSQLGKAEGEQANVPLVKQPIRPLVVTRTTNYANCHRTINPERITIEEVASSNQKIRMH